MNWAGIIGGAMAGGGTAWQQASRDQALAEDRERLEAKRAEMETNRQVAMEKMRHENNTANTKQAHDFAMERQGDSQMYGLIEKAQDRDARREEGQNDREWRSGESALDRKNRLDSANISAGARPPHTVTSGDGRIGTVVDGKFVPYMDGDKPLSGSKDMSQGTLAQLRVLESETNAANTSLLKLQADSMMDANSPQMRQAQDRLRLAQSQQKAVLASSGFAVPEAARDKPSESNIANLKKFGNDPAAISQFNARFGSGSAESVLGDAIKSGKPVDAINPGKEDKKPGILSGATKAIPSMGDMLTDSLTQQDETAQTNPVGFAKREKDAAERRTQIKALTPEIAKALDKSHADAILKKFGGDGSELPEGIRNILQDK